MTKELQDHVWSILPKEFKEEVKKEYRKGYVCETLTMLITLFGHHNLTSDAEEEEILTVPRKDIVELFQEVQKTISQCKGTALAVQSVGIKNVLWSFFGSKCLPDNIATSAPNVDSSHGNIDSLSQNPPENCNKANHISTDDSKPAEPTDFGKEVNFPTKKQSRNFSQETANCDNRLQIAAMAMQGILSNENAIQYAINNFRLQDGSRNRYQAVAECSLAFADALIAESEKRSEHGK